MSHGEVHEDLKLKLISEIVIITGPANSFGMANTLVKETISNAITFQIADIETIVATAKAVYDQYVAPVDLKAIPNFIEPAFDAMVWRGIEALIRAGMQWLKPQPAPGFAPPK